MEHVRTDLSAYLDGALAPERRSAVEAHVAGCTSCRSSLGELRSTARLIAALPLSVPSRRLVPALAPRTSWLRPLRSLSAVATGAFLLVFMASATLDTGFRMGGGGSSPSSGRLIGGPTPAAAAFEAARSDAAAPRTDTATVGAPGAAGSPRPAGSPSLQGQADAQRGSAQSSAVPKAAGPEAPPVDQLTGTARGSQIAADAPEPVRLGNPWLWLGFAMLSALFAFVAHRRLRAR